MSSGDWNVRGCWLASVARVALSVTVGVALCLCLVPSAAIGRPTGRVRIHARIPGAVRALEATKLVGRVLGAPHGSRVVLEEERAGRWSRANNGTVPIRRGRFAFLWEPELAVSTVIRLTVVDGTHYLASSTYRRVQVRPRAEEPCPEPAPPQSAPAGDGWIFGRLIDGGGPLGVSHSGCVASAYVVTVLNEAGATVASVDVPGPPGYVIFLGPGRYTLTTFPCGGSGLVTVTTGQPTKADVECVAP